ncbi:MAG: hypothetical protein DI546_01605 [Rhizobium sp.]|nr:MAG: hypothetical protein DI546_01605 [Rhizobium sp.]
MSTAILYKSCEYCERPHVRDGDDFSPDRFCAVCSGDRRAIAAAVLKARPVSRSEIEASGRYLKRSSVRA